MLPPGLAHSERPSLQHAALQSMRPVDNLRQRVDRHDPHNKKTEVVRRAQLTKIELTPRLPCEPHSLPNVRAEVRMLLLQKRRRPVRVRASEEWVLVPRLEVEVGRCGDGNRRIHSLQHRENFVEDPGARKRSNAPGEGILRKSVC
jgi:hypothetical protein